MAKDDYQKFVFVILAFLYRRAKGEEKTPTEEYILPLTEHFPIREEYLWYIVEQMQERGLIEQARITRAWGGTIAEADMSAARITFDGIDYLRDNSTMRKLARVLREGREIISLFL